MCPLNPFWVVIINVILIVCLKTTCVAINVLSFDGGGSRGFMEIQTLDHVMRLTTSISNNPDYINFLIGSDEFLETTEIVEAFWNEISKLDSTEVMQPADYFNYIVGKYFAPGSIARSK